MRLNATFAVVAISAVLGCGGSSGEEEAVASTVNELYRAIEGRDAEAVCSYLEPEALAPHVADASREGIDTCAAFFRTAFETSSARVPPPVEPDDVEIDGPVATVALPDEEAISLERVDNRWRVTSLPPG